VGLHSSKTAAKEAAHQHHEPQAEGHNERTSNYQQETAAKQTAARGTT